MLLPIGLSALLGKKLLIYNHLADHPGRGVLIPAFYDRPFLKDHSDKFFVTLYSMLI